MVVKPGIFYTAVRVVTAYSQGFWWTSGIYCKAGEWIESQSNRKEVQIVFCVTEKIQDMKSRRQRREKFIDRRLYNQKIVGMKQKTKKVQGNGAVNVWRPQKSDKERKLGLSRRGDQKTHQKKDIHTATSQSTETWISSYCYK